VSSDSVMTSPAERLVAGARPVRPAWNPSGASQPAMTSCRYGVVGAPSIASTSAALRRFAVSNTSNGPSPASVTSAPAIPRGNLRVIPEVGGRDVGQNVATAVLR
jgi:hypothetical protein